MIDLVNIIINEFNECEMKEGHINRKCNKKVFIKDDAYDKLMKQKLNMEEYSLYINHEDDAVRYWSDRDDRLVKFTIDFMRAFFQSKETEGKKRK